MTSMVPELWALTDQGWNAVPPRVVAGPRAGHCTSLHLRFIRPGRAAIVCTCPVITSAESKSSRRQPALSQRSTKATVVRTVTIMFPPWSKDDGRGGTKQN